MAANTVVTFPTPAYSNPPIEPQFYQPSVFFISAITLGSTTIVTTTFDHNYVIGQQVRLLIPPSFGSVGLNERSGYVISIPASNKVEINIDSIGISVFTTSSAKTQPQITAIGDVNTGIISATGPILSTTNIPGSFINISPL